MEKLKSTCCNQSAVKHHNGEYFCGGVDGCGKWCEVREETKNFREQVREEMENSFGKSLLLLLSANDEIGGKITYDILLNKMESIVEKMVLQERKMILDSLESDFKNIWYEIQMGVSVGHPYTRYKDKLKDLIKKKFI